MEKHFGSGKGVAETKKGYRLQHEVMTSADLTQMINSDAIQSVLKDQKPQAKRTRGTKANPLRNKRAMDKLNPYAAVLRKMRRDASGAKKKIVKRTKAQNKRSSASKKALSGLLGRVDQEVDALTDVYRSQMRSMNIK